MTGVSGKIASSGFGASVKATAPAIKTGAASNAGVAAQQTGSSAAAAGINAYSLPGLAPNQKVNESANVSVGIASVNGIGGVMNSTAGMAVAGAGFGGASNTPFIPVDSSKLGLQNLSSLGKAAGDALEGLFAGRKKQKQQESEEGFMAKLGRGRDRAGGGGGSQEA